MALAICAHCHRQMGDYVGGWATINGEPVCHPNVDTRPDCYHLCTVGHHDIPCDRAECIEDVITQDANRALKEMSEIKVLDIALQQWRLDADEH